MRELIGSPGKVSGLVLRIVQCLVAASAMGVMASTSGFSISTAFCYLIASMGLQVCWSFTLACYDFDALRHKKELRTRLFLSMFGVGDWVTMILSFAAACSSAGVIMLFMRNTLVCKPLAVGESPRLALDCSMFKISVSLAFIAWFLLAISSQIMFWLLTST